ncbi:MAG: glycosyltransferase [Magnetococcales bacterium]|nr:glycosyltransferase [Magnetococcales bacterium]
MFAKRPPIIAFAPHPWWSHWLSRQQLLTRLGQRGWPIIYSFGPLDFWDRHLPLWQQSPWRGRIQFQDHVWVEHPGRLLPIWSKFPAWDRYVIRRHALSLKQALAAHGGADKAVALLFHPAFQSWLKWLQPGQVAYHIYDTYNMMEEWSPEMAAREAALVSSARLITTSSAGMAANLPGDGPRRARVLNNGADSELFLNGAGARCPADLAAIPHPRIGYVGAINAKLDLEMVLSVSQKRPEWHWVFLGHIRMNGQSAEAGQVRDRWAQLLTRNNVHYLGQKPREQMPAYVNNMDALTICYKIARLDQGEAASWVVHGYPTKLHEFLATGLPVVAGPQQVIVDDFSHVVRVAADSAQWEASLAEALLQGGVGTPAARQQVALANTWDKRVDLLEGWLEEMTGPPSVLS